MLAQCLLYQHDQRLGFFRLPHSPSKKILTAGQFGGVGVCVKPTNMQNQSPTGRQILYPDTPLLSNAIRPSSQDQKETPKKKAAWNPVGKGWLWRPFLPPAAADPGEKPSGLTFSGPPAASALVPTSRWGCFGQSPSLSSPCCGRKVQGVLAAGSSFAPPSALHTGSPSLSRVCWTRAAGDSDSLDLCCSSGGSWTPGMRHFTHEPRAAFAVLFFTIVLWYSCLAGMVFFFYAPLSIPCLSPPLLSIPKYIAQ